MSSVPVPAKRGPKPGHTPDFTGVPGELVTDIPEGLDFGRSTRKSPYDELLHRLKAETDKWSMGSKQNPQPALRFTSSRARASLGVRAKKLDYKITFAEFNNFLYVRYSGPTQSSADLQDKRRMLIVKTLRIAKNDGFAGGAMTAIQISMALRNGGDNTMDAQLCGSILTQMEKAGTLERKPGDKWALRGA